MDKLWKPHKMGQNSRGTMTENETLEEEVAQLNARISLLVNAGADYRKKVDNLFAVTKEESQQEESKTNARVQQLEELSRKLTDELQNVNGMLGQERLINEKKQHDIDQLVRENGELARGIEAAVAAQRRVEEELETTARAELQHRQQQRSLEDRIQELETINTAQTSELARRSEELLAMQEKHDNQERISDETNEIQKEATRLQIERASFEQLIKALQNRNQELERESTEARTALAQHPPLEAYNQALQTEAAMIEKLKNTENSNRVLHREADRRKQTMESAQQKVEELSGHVEILEMKLAECLSEKQDVPRGECVSVGTDARLEEDWKLKYEELQREHQLLTEHRDHERHVEEQVRELCEELDAEVERLMEENSTLRDGLSTIENTFGKFLPAEEEPSVGGESSVVSDRPQPTPRRALLCSKEKFTQTLSVFTSTKEPAGVKEQELAGVETELKQLKAQREAERTAATIAFKAKIKEVLAMFSNGETPQEIVVEVTYPAVRAAVMTPAHRGEVEPPSGAGGTEGIELLRRRTAEATEWERKYEVTTMLAQQLNDENEDLKEHVRRLTSSDPQARTLNALLGTSIRSAEKRINETLSRYKTVLRSRSLLVSLVASSMKSLSQLRDVAGEMHIWLRSCLGNHACLLPDIDTRLSVLNDHIERTRAEHKRVSTECFTQWERTQTGIASDSSKKVSNYRDVTGDLRSMEDLLNTLWVSFTVQKIPRKPEQRRLYSPVATARGGPPLDFGPLDGVTPPLVQIGHTAGQHYHSPAHKGTPNDGFTTPKT
eukprot:TRINITY_DN8181_c1_g2_i1.p1 TRINITY_DN8181_c1_g2~~TRINITY_DN8181_c1_g2_i1.p1  ORF type:complete len:842 (+),score=225.58 TRINITY_DN8181_c1_g2_i1:173-2527(+)